MGTQRKLVIVAFLCLAGAGCFANNYKDSSNWKSPYNSAKWLRITAYSGFNLYPAGRFTSEYGPYSLSSNKSSIFTGGFGLEYSNKKNKFLAMEGEFCTIPTYYILRMPANASDSVYTPYSYGLKIVDLNLFQYLCGFGVGRSKNLNRRFSVRWLAMPTASLGFNSAGHRFREGSLPPYVVGAKQDTILYFGIRQKIIVPGLRLRGSIAFNMNHFQLSLSSSFTWHASSQVNGNYIFFPNLKEESRGAYKSSQFVFGFHLGVSYALGFRKKETKEHKPRRVEHP